MRNGKINLFDKSREEIVSLFKNLGYEKYRADQLLGWMYKKRVFDFSSMSNFSKKLRTELEKTCHLSLPKVLQTTNGDDGSVKYLLELLDGEHIEAVKLAGEKHITLCVSTQVGCPLGCAFCATGKKGFTRNLLASEIVEQIVLLSEQAEKPKPVNIVFMGMGEPFLNCDALFKSIEIVTLPRGLNIPQRRITVSTSGIKGKFRLLHSLFPAVGISFSLNSTDSDLRSELMPVNVKNPLPEVLRELKGLDGGHRPLLTLEYVMIKGLNDRQDDAGKLADTAVLLNAKVNLIPLNEVSSFAGEAPEEKTIEFFLKIISKKGVVVSVRRSRGRGIAAACGQLDASCDMVQCDKKRISA